MTHTKNDRSRAALGRWIKRLRTAGLMVALTIGAGSASAQEGASASLQGTPSVAVQGAVPLTAGRVAELERELEDVRLELRLRRDFERAEVRLLDLWLELACPEPFESQIDLLTRLAWARAELAQARGDAEAARGALAHLFLDPAQPLGGREVQTVPVPEASLRLERLVVESSLLIEERERIRVEPGQGVESEESSVLPADDSQVIAMRGLVENAFWNNINSLGVTALPALETVARLSLGEAPRDHNSDPLFILCTLSPTRAARVAADGLRTGDVRWSLRIVRTLAEGGLKQNQMGPRQRELVVEEWGRVVDRLLAQPAISAGVLPVAFDLCQAGYASGILPTAVVRAWESEDVDVRNVVLKAFEGRIAARASLRPFGPLLQEMIEGRDEELSGLALKWAQEHLGSPILRRYVRDPDPRRRLALAEAIAKDSWARHPTKNTPMGLSEANEACFLILAGDRKTPIRRLVVETGSLVPHSEAFEALFPRLAQDPELGIRRIVAKTVLRDPRLQGETLLLLAADEELEVLDAVDITLATRLPEEFRAACVPALEARLSHPNHPLIEALEERWRGQLYRNFAELPEALPALVRAAIAHPDPAFRAALHNGITQGAPWTASLSRLPDEFLGPLVLQLCRGSGLGIPGNTYIQKLFPASEGLTPARRDLLADLARRPEQGPLARLRALVSLLHVGDARGRSQLISTLSTLGALGDGGLAHLGAELQVLRQGFARAELELAMLEALGDPRLPDEVLLRFLVDERRSSPELARAEVARFGEQAARGDFVVDGVVGAALRSLVAQPSAEDVPLVASFLRRDRGGDLELTRALASTSDPLWFELLEDCLRVPWLDESDEREELIAAAIDGLTNYLSDEAGQVLLTAARDMPTPELRERCIEGVRSIRTFLEEERRFASQRALNLERGRAVERLIEMLGDPEMTIRIEALRGLATLRAVEALPLVIECLRSLNEVERKAAREALERLNAPGADGASD